MLIAIDHLFVDHEQDGLAQAVYDALGSLDAAWPAAIAPIAAADLALLVEAARDHADASGRECAALQGAARRVGHVLERTPRPRAGLQRRPGRFVSGTADCAGIDPGSDGGTVFTLGMDVG